MVLGCLDNKQLSLFSKKKTAKIIDDIGFEKLQGTK